MKYILKLFPEIMVKGQVVKKRMIKQLHENLLNLMRRFVGDSVEVTRYWDKIEVFCPAEKRELVERILTQTPGVEWVLTASSFDFKTLDDINGLVLPYAEPLIADKTFVVRVKRTGTHDFTSFEAERTVGGFLNQNAAAKGVDLHQPDVTIKLEIHQNQLNLITKKTPGLGGFPLGTQGEILSLMSGGFDSTIASYLTMKRGLKTHFIFFNLGGKAHEIGVKQVALYLWSQFGASHRVKFISVPFEKVVAEIFNSIHETYMGVILKRLMLMASEQIADQMGIDALLTGESVAQVSSQTLRNLALIDQVTDKLVLRPLAMMNKPEIMAIADQIGTRYFAESMPEYCGVISKNPVTHGSFKRVVKEAARFDKDVLPQAVSEAQVIAVDEIIQDINQQEAIEVVSVLTGQVVIDIRAPEQVQVAPLVTDAVVKLIPFYQLNTEFAKLDSAQKYVLYCDKGVMSQLHGQYLADQGFHNIQVWRPE